MKKFKTKVLSWLDRNYNLKINKEKCIRIYFRKHIYEYNNIIVIQGVEKTACRCLGKGWYKIIKVNE